MGPREILIIVLLIVILFGARKLPELARSIGRSARIFKSEVKEMREEDQRDEQAASAQSQDDFWDSPENQPRQIPPHTQQQNNYGQQPNFEQPPQQPHQNN